MEFRVLVERRAFKQIERLDESVKNRILDALRELGSGFSAKLDIKKLRGYRNHYRVRVGDYRILFELGSSRIIVVYAVLRREKAYG